MLTANKRIDFANSLIDIGAISLRELRYGILLYVAVHTGLGLCATSTRVDAAEFYAIVEQNGTVAICLSKGSILFADRCEGIGRLTVVQPIKDGTVVWRSAVGAVSLESEVPKSPCTIGRAKWDPKAEEVISTGRKIGKIDIADTLNHLKQHLLKETDAVEDDISGFTLDLDNDGRNENVFVASSLKRVADRYSNDGKPAPYFTYAGVLHENSLTSTFFGGTGDYGGGTDAIGDVTIKGVVPIAPGTGELGLLIKAASLDGTQTLIRYRSGLVQRIETIEFNCN